MRITIISDNKASKERLIGRHSLSVLIERNGVLYLFGLASDPYLLEYNTRKLGISLDVVDYVIISHEHRAHYGGFRYIASEAPYISVFIPYGSMEYLGRLLSVNALRPREIVKWTVLDTGAHISEPYQGPPYEHFLVIERGEGLVVFSGCMHSGPQVLRAISSYFGKKVDVIIGGFHLLNAPSDILEFYVKFLHDAIKPRVVIPLHCSGERLISELKKCGDIEVLEMGAGDEFEV